MMNSKTSKPPSGKTCNVFLDVMLAVSQWDLLSSVLFHPGPAHFAHFPECHLLQRRNVNIFLPDENQCVVQWIMVFFFT